jgi:hypothetical protein
MGDGRWEMGDGRWEMGEKEFFSFQFHFPIFNTINLSGRNFSQTQTSKSTKMVL